MFRQMIDVLETVADTIYKLLYPVSPRLGYLLCLPFSLLAESVAIVWQKFE